MDFFLKTKIANIEDIVLLYRVHDEAISTQMNQEQIKMTKSICEKVWQAKGKSYIYFANN